MDNNELLRLKNFFDSSLYNKCIVRLIGNLESNLSLSSFKYAINSDILTIVDTTCDYFIKINLNQVCNVAFKKNSVCLFLDFDVSVLITF